MIDIFVNVYLPRFFDWVIETSIMASILVGLILCIKILLRSKLSPRWQYMLWMILIVRLLLPWSPDSSYSIYSLLSYSSSVSEVFQKDTTLAIQQKRVSEDKTNPLVTTEGDSYKSNSVNEIKESDQIDSNKKKEDTTLSVYKVTLYIWIFGVAILAMITCITNRRLYSYIKKQPNITDEKIVRIFENCKQSMGIKKQVQLRLAGKISSPTVFGIFFPKVLLSSRHMKVLNEQQLKYIFYHELSHIKRRDIAVNWVLYGLIILNWFNPILWYAYSCMREDQELACDAFALTFIESEEQIAYGHTIITLLEHYSSYYQVPSLANLSRNKRTLKRRILMIKKFQKKSYRWSALGIVAIVVVASLSLFNARVTEGKEKQKDKVEQSNDAFQNAVDMLFGTEENARKEWGMSKESYKMDTDYLYLAEKYLTKEEFEQYIQFYKEKLSIRKKAMVSKEVSENFEGDVKWFKEELLSQADNKKLNDLYNQSQSLGDKIDSHLRYTLEEAQKVVDFQINKPIYTVEGYSLKSELAGSFLTRKPEILVESKYVKGKYSYTIYQSPLLEQKKDPFNRNGNDNIETYELEGNQVFYGTVTSDKNLQSMKMIVPAKGKNSAYQIVITNPGTDYQSEKVPDRNVNKAELEKIMLSMLK
ncbi:M56 family metallopeptidase [Bacillus wiedmannii]|uniref:M56 family metallopeptidase n=3 Tax=Bacillus wiedmannii TaxID=1890302 RepID=UPI0021128290|nr:M56 family metallopeptidase [Bacillus wiedmannii]MCQ6574556.1 M56 family metallopeptidase [Bacillus wiedmannii]